MKIIYIVVEGETEERFLRQVVSEHFVNSDIHIKPQQWITNRKLGTSGGGSSFDLIENHIHRLISQYKSDPSVYISVMVDLYAFPKQGNTIYDSEVSNLRRGIDKALLLQKKFAERIGYRNFIPYVQLHEYESLLFSNPDALTGFFTDKSVEIGRLKKEVNGLEPEEINETPAGAPSRRIIKHIPTYAKQKTTAGVITAKQIGLPLLRQKCPHFNDWITKLENV